MKLTFDKDQTELHIYFTDLIDNPWRQINKSPFVSDVHPIQTYSIGSPVPCIMDRYIHILKQRINLSEIHYFVEIVNDWICRDEKLTEYK